MAKSLKSYLKALTTHLSADSAKIILKNKEEYKIMIAKDPYSKLS